MRQHCEKHPDYGIDSKGRCRECRRINDGLARAANPEHHRKLKRAWRSNREAVAKYFGKVCAKHAFLEGERSAEGTCLQCAREAMNRYQRPRREKEKALRKAEKELHWSTDKVAVLAARAAAIKVAREKYRKANTEKHTEGQALRRANKKRATPEWANGFFIAEAYHLAKVRERTLGGKWHVDHIVPLQAKTVCGLHVEHNLRVVPEKVNISKGNRYWPNMPR